MSAALSLEPFVALDMVVPVLAGNPIMRSRDNLFAAPTDMLQGEVSHLRFELFPIDRHPSAPSDDNKFSGCLPLRDSRHRDKSAPADGG